MMEWFFDPSNWTVGVELPREDRPLVICLGPVLIVFRRD